MIEPSQASPSDHTTDWYKLVPKRPHQQAAWRMRLLWECRKDKDLRAAIYEICRRDILFFFNSVLVLYEPRKRGNRSKIIPFCTFKRQDEVILAMKFAIMQGKDIFGEKSRDEGFTMIAIGVFLHCFVFEDFNGLMVSRNEDCVEKSGDPKTLFWKLDFMLENLPSWMRPPTIRRKAHIQNLRNRAVIDGDSTTSDLGSGDRRTAMFMDEFSKFPRGVDFAAWTATRDVTACRIVTGTANGASNAHYAVRCSGIEVVDIFWFHDPRKNRGLYRVDERGKLEIIDKTFKFPSNYPFKMDRKWPYRSPWFDREESRCASDYEIAQELFGDYHGSAPRFIDAATRDRWVADMCEPHYLRGILRADDDHMPIDFVSDPSGGMLRLWCELVKGYPPEGQYCIGVDVSTGTGKSPSVAHVSDIVSGRQVGIYVNAHATPDELARVLFALGTWFYNAMIIWDVDGPGRIFGKKLNDYHYPSIYKRKRLSGAAAVPGIANEAHGFKFNAKNKFELFIDLKAALESRRYRILDLETLTELARFNYERDTVTHEVAQRSGDPADGGQNHGDRGTAATLAQFYCSTARPHAMQAESNRKKTFRRGTIGWQDYQKSLEAMAQHVVLNRPNGSRIRPRSRFN